MPGTGLQESWNHQVSAALTGLANHEKNRVCEASSGASLLIFFVEAFIVIRGVAKSCVSILTIVWYFSETSTSPMIFGRHCMIF